MRVPLLTFVPVLVCGLLTPWARAQDAGMLQQKGAIAGTVVDAVNGQPLRGAEVKLRGSGGAAAPAAQLTSTNTDAVGRFMFEGLSAGRYVLVASHDGYANNNRENPGLPGRMLSIAPGQHVNDVVLRLTPYGAIAGHITNEAGKPLRGVSVQALRSFYSRQRRELRDEGHAVSNEAGEYRITGLAPGKYYIRGKAPHSLTVKGSDKAYVPIYYPAADDRARSVALVLRAGEELAGIDLNFLPMHTIRIRGRVISALGGAPSKEAEVTLLSDQGETVFASQNLSGGEGSFEFQDVPPGSYVLVAQQPGSVHQPKPMWGRTSIEAGDSNIEHAEVVVSPGVDIRGRVRVEGKTATDFDNMVGMLDLAEAPSLAAITPDIDPAEVKPDGTFIFHEVPEGSYRISFHPVPAGFYLKSSGAADVLEAGIAIGPGHAPPPFDLVLSSGAGQIDGTVASGEQSPPGIVVVLVPDGKQRAQPNNYRQAVSDRLGRFAMRNVSPGDYMLFAWQQVERGAYLDPEFIAQYEDRGKDVHVEEGSQLNVQLDVIPAADTIP